MVNRKVESLFKDFKPMNEPTITVKVGMEPSSMVDELAKVIYEEVQRIAGSTGTPTCALTEEDVLKASKTLVFLRVLEATRTDSAVFHQYRVVNKHFAVPVLLYHLLIPIGVVRDPEFSITFIPEASIAGDDLLAPEEMMRVSDVFTRLENRGFKVVYGIPRGEEGELDFMAMTHVEQAILSYRSKSHPVYAFYASFFRQKEFNEVTGMMSRVLYGYDSDFRYLIRRAFNLIDGDME